MKYFGHASLFLISSNSLENVNFSLEKVRLPLKVATFKKTRAFTFRKFVAVQDMSIPKATQKYK